MSEKEWTIELKSQFAQEKLENEYYLRSHPDLKSILRTFVNLVLIHKPDDIHSFAKDVFSKECEVRMAAPLSESNTNSVERSNVEITESQGDSDLPSNESEEIEQHGSDVDSEVSQSDQSVLQTAV